MKIFASILLAATVIMFLAPDDLMARGNNEGPIIYVEGQDLFFDAVVAADPLPMKGPFQELYICNVNGAPELCTEYGPRDVEYTGGRWWVDTNGNRIMDIDDHYFSCPLLGPGRETK